MLYGVSNLASCHLDSQALHCMLEFDTVFPALDCINLDSDYFYIIFIKNSCRSKFRTKVKT